MALNGKVIDGFVVNGADASVINKTLSYVSATTTRLTNLAKHLKSLVINSTSSVTLKRLLTLFRKLTYTSTSTARFLRGLRKSFAIVVNTIAKLTKLPIKSLKATATSTVKIKKAISKHLSIISEHVLVVLTDFAIHLVSLVITAHSAAKIKKGIAKTIKVTSTVVTNMFKKIPRTIKATAISSVKIIKAIAKKIKATVTSTSSIVTHFFYFRLLQITVTSTTRIKRAFAQLLKYVAIIHSSLFKKSAKLLKVVSSTTTKLFHEFVLIFGAVPLHTFIVPSKKLKVTIVKVLTLIMTKGKK
jgi:hypothetical protein